MFIRFYNRCVMCDKKYYEEDKIGCTYPSKVCPECRKYYDRAKQLECRIKGENGKVDYKFVRRLLDHDKCEYCDKRLSWEEREIEHKTPVSRGGDNSNNNLCISCFDCNHEKNDRDYNEYIAYRKTLQITASEIRTFLDLLSKHTLLISAEHIEEEVITKTSNSSGIKNKIIRDENGKVIGLRKIIPEVQKIKIKKKVIETHLTEWGEVYNTFCKMVGRKILKEGIESLILEETSITA